MTRLGKNWARPLYRIDEANRRLDVGRTLSDAEWDTIISIMAEKKIEALDASGQMTDAALARVAELDHVTRLQFAGSRRLTDAGLRHLARLPHLRWLNLSGCAFTDRGLEILRQLPELRTFELHWHQDVSDAGLAHLVTCDLLERVDLMGSPVGDGVIHALAGKRHLRYLKTETRVTNAALPVLHQFPIFKAWHGGEVHYSLMGAEAEPNRLMLDGLSGLSNLRTYYAGQTKITDRSLEVLSGMPSLEVLEFWNCAGITNAGAAMLARLPRLRDVSFDSCRQVTAEVTTLFPAHVRSRHTA